MHQTQDGANMNDFTTIDTKQFEALKKILEATKKLYAYKLNDLIDWSTLIPAYDAVIEARDEYNILAETLQWK